jgi:hypothetical protein
VARHAELLLRSSVFAKISRIFQERSAESEDAILLNFFCPSCRKDMFGAREIREFEEDEIIFEAECPRCGRRCKLRYRDVP